MNNTVLKRTYSTFPFDENQILLFAGVTGVSPQTESLLKECLKEVENTFTYKVCFAECDIKRTDNFLDFGLFKTSSNSLKSHLKNCDSAIIFAATVGLNVDKLIARYSKISPSKALIMGAIGNERIEGLCDIFCKEIKNELQEKNLVTTTRFSAGYGDFPLEYQKDFFRILDCPRNIGLTLNDSLIMSPTKSVTAIIGLKRIENQ